MSFHTVSRSMFIEIGSLSSQKNIKGSKDSFPDGVSWIMVNLEILLECFKHFYYYYFGDGRRSFEYFVSSDGFIALIPSKCFLFLFTKT